MGTYSAPGVAAALDEKNYSSYSLKWEREMTHGAATIWIMILDMLGGFVHVVDNLSWLSLYRLSDGAETVVGNTYPNWAAFNQFASVRSRYQAQLNNGVVEVYRAGSLVASIPLTSGWTRAMWAISPDGKYVVVVDYLGAAPYWVRCYEGQL